MACWFSFCVCERVSGSDAISFSYFPVSCSNKVNTVITSVMARRLRLRFTGENGYGCGRCGAFLCDSGDVVSRSFHGKHGKAYLVDRCLNYYFGPQEEKTLMTGPHIVRDVFCSSCDRYVGWTYDFAHAEKERYKTHRFVLERKLLRAIRTDATTGVPDLSVASS